MKRSYILIALCITFGLMTGCVTSKGYLTLQKDLDTFKQEYKTDIESLQGITKIQSDEMSSLKKEVTKQTKDILNKINSLKKQILPGESKTPEKENTIFKPEVKSDEQTPKKPEPAKAKTKYIWGK
jgi:hypothetical protein